VRWGWTVMQSHRVGAHSKKKHECFFIYRRCYPAFDCGASFLRPKFEIFCKMAGNGGDITAGQRALPCPGRRSRAQIHPA
jgi:hypothetical protein